MGRSLLKIVGAVRAQYMHTASPVNPSKSSPETIPALASLRHYYNEFAEDTDTADEDRLYAF
jgi:hypothetical protein